MAGEIVVPDDFGRIGEELPVRSEHAVAIESLPIHHDPFDRLLVAQATVEGIALLTSDPPVARYPAPVRKI